MHGYCRSQCPCAYADFTYFTLRPSLCGVQIPKSGHAEGERERLLGARKRANPVYWPSPSHSVLSASRFSRCRQDKRFSSICVSQSSSGPAAECRRPDLIRAQMGRRTAASWSATPELITQKAQLAIQSIPISSPNQGVRCRLNPPGDVPREGSGPCRPPGSFRQYGTASR